MDKELLLGVFIGCAMLFGGGFAIGYHTAANDETVNEWAKEQANQASLYASENY